MYALFLESVCAFAWGCMHLLQRWFYSNVASALRKFWLRALAYGCLSLCREGESASGLGSLFGRFCFSQQKPVMVVLYLSIPVSE